MNGHGHLNKRPPRLLLRESPEALVTGVGPFYLSQLGYGGRPGMSNGNFQYHVKRGVNG
jgi:hypothetical protein